MSSSSSSPSAVRRSLYDVLLSFSGTDTRTNFTSHLLDALNQQGFSTFHDETKLERGEDIRFQLPTAISQSRVSIIVFSKNYAASGWCLDELVKIMDCKRNFHQIVLPIFYDVDPSDVRRQIGVYKKAFEKHEDRFKGTSSMERVERWREALTQAANLSGWHLQNVVDGNEAKLIKIVVNEVINRLDKLYCDVADHPVGIDSRVQELKRRLKLESDDVTIVAVWGVGGIGKTTIAKAAFNNIRNNFEGSSFLADVSETSKTSSGVVALQKQLLSNILRNETHSLDNYHQGIDQIKQKLRHRRVLLVVDDVDKVQQLKMLAINRDVFCAGSKIIITTRNKSSVPFISEDSFYSPVELKVVESLNLFCWNAFETDHPKEGYSELSQEVVAYAEGLPLALEVLGSYFASIRNKAEWESGLKKLRKHLPKDIQGKLKISFESLDKKDQDLFLDIAFFFTGREKDFAVKVLEDSVCFPEIGIGELARRCLIRVEANRLWMHNLMREMAREIVYQEFSKKPAKRSRLRGHEEVLQVLRDSVGREAIEGLYLELPELNDEDINVAAFADMWNLRLLHLNYLRRLTGTNLTISRKLKWLCWHGFPLTHIPDDVYMENLVAIDLQYSKLKQIWRGPKRLDKLRFLNLSYSCCLTKTPDFSGLKNLEELLLHDCTNLVEVDYSIGCLEKLVILNMANCRSLRKIPSSICMLTSLQHLNLSGCSSFGQGESRGFFPMFRRLLPYYKECVPISAVSIQGLQALHRLRNLNLSWCNLSNVPSEIGNLMSLKILDLSGNKFSSLPSTLSNLPRLDCLYLCNCDQLKQLPAFSYNLMWLNADNCLALEFESVGTQLGRQGGMSFRGCPRLDYKKFEKNIIGFRYGSVLPSYDELSVDLDLYLRISTSRKFSFVVPDTSQNFRGWILCIMIYVERMGGIHYDLVNKTKGKKVNCAQKDGPLVCHSGEGTKEIIWVKYVRVSENGFNVEGGDDMELFVCHDPNGGRVKNCVLRLICEGDEINLLGPKCHALDIISSQNYQSWWKVI